MPGGPSGDEWYVAPASVPKAIGDLRQIDERRERRSTPQPAMSHTVVVAPERIDEPDTARHGATDLDIFEHPYVKRLERQIEKLETKYEAQVRRTEEVQLKAHEKLVELQRMTTIGQSKTLADFMLQAKNWLVGPTPEEAIGGEMDRPGDATSNPVPVDNMR
jgi:hypothetical protein